VLVVAGVVASRLGKKNIEPRTSSFSPALLNSSSCINACFTGRATSNHQEMGWLLLHAILITLSRPFHSLSRMPLPCSFPSSPHHR